MSSLRTLLAAFVFVGWSDQEGHGHGRANAVKEEKSTRDPLHERGTGGELHSSFGRSWTTVEA